MPIGKLQAAVAAQNHAPLSAQERAQKLEKIRAFNGLHIAAVLGKNNSQIAAAWQKAIPCMRDKDVDFLEIVGSTLKQNVTLISTLNEFSSDKAILVAWNSITSHITPEQFAAITYFTHGGDHLNAVIREAKNGGKMPADWAKYDAILEKALAAIAAVPDFLENKAQGTWRGATGSTQYTHLQEGDITSTSSYSSTSGKQEVAYAFAMADEMGLIERINNSNAPPEAVDIVRVMGHSGVNLEQLSAHSSEKEVLYPKDAQFRVLLADKNRITSFTSPIDPSDAIAVDVSKYLFEEVGMPPEFGTQGYDKSLLDAPLKKAAQPSDQNVLTTPPRSKEV